MAINTSAANKLWEFILFIGRVLVRVDGAWLSRKRLL
jgi:hypothetical protein